MKKRLWCIVTDYTAKEGEQYSFLERAKENDLLLIQYGEKEIEKSKKFEEKLKGIECSLQPIKIL